MFEYILLFIQFMFKLSKTISFIKFVAYKFNLLLLLQDDRLLAECRVRYLSFLGIGKVIKHSAFVMHTAQDTFMAHVFYCEPSSGALCKTIEAACKVCHMIVSSTQTRFNRDSVPVAISKVFRRPSSGIRHE